MWEVARFISNSKRESSFFKLKLLKKVNNQIGQFAFVFWSIRNCFLVNYYCTEVCMSHMVIRVVEFSSGGTKLERCLPKNQHTQRKWLNLKNWFSGELSNIGPPFSNKVTQKLMLITKNVVLNEKKLRKMTFGTIRWTISETIFKTILGKYL